MLKFKIADITYTVSSDVSTSPMHMDRAYHDFYGPGNPEVTIHVHNRDLPKINWQQWNRVFDSEMVWSLYQRNDKFIFALRSPALGPSPYSIALFDNDFRQGEIYYRPPENGNGKVLTLLSPLAYPLAEALTVCLLSRGRGVMMHAGGVIDNGRGYLFAGNSGHGKSTMTKLWHKKGVVLNDDRIIVRYLDNRYWIYGTPWHGEYNVVSPQRAPLEKIFILKHGDRNHVEKLEGAQAVSMLLTRCFPPFWDKQGMQFTVNLFAEMIHAIPCYSLEFKPDENIVDFVQCVK